MKDLNENGLSPIISQALSEMEAEIGESFCLERVNLAELERRTGITRAKLRRLKENGFAEQEHGLKGRKSAGTVLSGFSSVLDDMLMRGACNSSVCFEQLKRLGYNGSLSSIKRYIASHKSLIPAKRQLVASQGNRGRRYSTLPGEAYQMDWGFTKAIDCLGREFRVACFAMICHHCGECYIEFFTSAKQENLFIGMIHAFRYMGIPKYVLTDNMKSVVTCRNLEGHPVWQRDYERFMQDVGFQTKLCKPRHPFTKGKVERLIRFVKDNFLADRVFADLSDLNQAAMQWCNEQNRKFRNEIDESSQDEHFSQCRQNLKEICNCKDILLYLCPERRISFDGFVTYEGRRFGVPYYYARQTVRVMRDGETISIFADDLSQKLTSYDVTWSTKDRLCPDQYVSSQPEELPTMPVKSLIQIKELPQQSSPFEKFTFDKEVEE